MRFKLDVTTYTAYTSEVRKDGPSDRRGLMSEQIFTMRLSSCGNPDWGQYAPISEPKVVTGSTLAEMRKAAEAYSEENNLGGGNWMNTVVKQGKKVIG